MSIWLHIPIVVLGATRLGHGVSSLGCRSQTWPGIRPSSAFMDLEKHESQGGSRGGRDRARSGTQPARSARPSTTSPRGAPAASRYARSGAQPGSIDDMVKLHVVPMYFRIYPVFTTVGFSVLPTIRAPLPDVTQHVVQAPRIRLPILHLTRTCLLMLILTFRPA